ncbi:MAG TPA: two-component regulator propeller domain-containing protein [bacterium]|nr:two-component regulator propeller domain-containing protein [bacterium]
MMFGYTQTGLAVLAFLATLGFGGTYAAESVKDVPFMQEYHVEYPVEASEGGNDIRTIAVDNSGVVWAGTKAGVYALRGKTWEPQSKITQGPIYDLYVDPAGAMWVAAWDGLYQIKGDQVQKASGVDGPVAVVGAAWDGLLALGPDGSWIEKSGKWSPVEGGWSRNDRAIVPDPDNRAVWLGTCMGLYRWDGQDLRLFFREEELFSGDIRALAFSPDKRLWIGSLGGIDVYANGKREKYFTTEKGLPNYDVRSLAFAPDGVLWVGTALGVVRYDGKNWSLRNSRRWLLSDDVRDVAFDGEGTAWIATAAGVSAIKKRNMTLADKAEHYLDICLKRHVRPPGLVEKCRFPNPKNRNVFEPIDDDNDGGYTSIYMVMECLRYAVTKDPKAKENADKTFDALEFLQTVTGTKGFVARTVVPTTWKKMADPNEKLSPQETVERRIHMPRYKIVPERWRLSADGKWLWKGDTSSDEITSHMFGYLFYYDLVADKTDKERVRSLISRIMDHIIDGGYVLRDIDGKATRWGVWSPEKLNGNPEWRTESHINSFEILSYLKTAYHITGDEKYQKEYLQLIEKHGYGKRVRRPKAYGMSERTHIDDELMIQAVPGLMLNEKDPALRGIYMEGITWAYRTVENDQNPYFNFTFGMIGGQGFHLEVSIAFLRDAPLDLIQWTVDNSKREDIRLVRWPMLEPLQLDRMLPPSERGVMRWDKNPWEAISGDFSDPEGHLESNGVFWLLPYWMGRYCGFIEGAK